MVRVSDLRVRGGGTVTAGNAVPSAGELAVFCRPVVTASALPRRDGTVRADGWLPDFVRLGELERHLGDGVIEEIVAAAVEQGLLKRRQRRRIMSYPLVTPKRGSAAGIVQDLRITQRRGVFTHPETPGHTRSIVRLGAEPTPAGTT